MGHNFYNKARCSTLFNNWHKEAMVFLKDIYFSWFKEALHFLLLQLKSSVLEEPIKNNRIKWGKSSISSEIPTYLQFAST